jgi:hypothetical protein
MTMLPIMPLPGQRKDREQLVTGDLVIASAWLTASETEVCAGTLQLSDGGFLVAHHWFAPDETIILDRYLIA